MILDIKKTLIFLGFLVIALSIIHFVLPYLMPFIIGLGISLLMEPSVKLVQKRFRISRLLAVASVLFFGLGTILLFFTLIIFVLVYELIELSYELPQIHENIDTYINLYFQDANHRLSSDMLEVIRLNVGSFSESFRDIIVTVVNSILSYIYTLPQTVTGGIILIVATLLSTFFISKDKGLLLSLWLKIAPGLFGQQALNIVQELVKAFFRYLKAQLILISITTGFCIIGLYTVGAKYAITVGILIGFFDFIPFLGPSAVFIPWIIWSFLIGNTVFAVKLLALYVIVLLLRQVLEMKVVAHSLGLHPLATLVAIYIGLKLLGLAGMIIGPLFLIVVQAAFKSGAITTIYFKR